jgi:hypothetical protein
MDGKSLREKFAYGFLGIYFIYGLFIIGMTGLLFSFAIGLIVSSFNKPIEIVVSAVILSGIVFHYFNSRRRKEGFQSGRPRQLSGMNGGVPTGKGDNLQDIASKVAEITQTNVFQPSGVLSSNYAECFQDINSSNQPNNAGSETAKPAGDKTPPPSDSTPAATNEDTVSKEMMKALPSSEAAAATTPDSKSNTPPKKTEEPKPVSSGFTDKVTDGMFKLGSIPADAVGGSHIDVGTTLMNALNSLKPDQVKQMTDDTRKLMETQKSLMGMLTTMKPMIQDGKQMMDAFGDMFGSK